MSFQAEQLGDSHDFDPTVENLENSELTAEQIRAIERWRYVVRLVDQAAKSKDRSVKMSLDDIVGVITLSDITKLLVYASKQLRESGITDKMLGDYLASKK